MSSDLPSSPVEQPEAPFRRPVAVAEKCGFTALLGIVWLAVMWLTWPDDDSLARWLLGYLWYWLRLAAWAVLLAASIAVIWKLWRSALAVLVAAALVLASGLATQLPFSPRMFLREPQPWFESHRSDFDAAVAWARTEDPSSFEHYGVQLPADLRYLTDDGEVSGGSGVMFFAQWYGVPDDAGGFLYSPGSSPAGYDMSGMFCKNPVDLRGGWWMCGMKE